MIPRPRPRRSRYPPPSGVALPAILQRLVPSSTLHEEDSGDNNDNTTTNNNTRGHDRCAQLDLQLQETVTAMERVQQQILVGEECYAEEAGPQNNVFKGWDSGFIDAPVAPASSSSNSNAASSQQSTTTNPTRTRLAADHRWFSGSWGSSSSSHKQMNSNNNSNNHKLLATAPPRTMQRFVPAVTPTVWSLSPKIRHQLLQQKKRRQQEDSAQQEQHSSKTKRQRVAVAPMEVENAAAKTVPDTDARVDDVVETDAKPLVPQDSPATTAAKRKPVAPPTPASAGPTRRTKRTKRKST